MYEIKKINDDGKGNLNGRGTCSRKEKYDVLLGTLGKSVLQQAIVDLGLVDLMQRLLSKESRTLRHKAVLAMTDSVKEKRLTH